MLTGDVLQIGSKPITGRWSNTVTRVRITLIAIGVLIFITSLYFGQIVISNFGSEPAQKAATRVTMREILSSVMQYRQCYHKWPVGGQGCSLCFTNDSASDRYRATYANDKMMCEGKLTDAWGTPFFITVSDHMFILISAGPDGETNTSDDITGWVPAEKKGNMLKNDDIIFKARQGMRRGINTNGVGQKRK